MRPAKGSLRAFSRSLRRVVSFDGGPALEGAKSFVAPGNDLVSLFQSSQYLDIRGSGNSCLYGNEDSAKLLAVVPQHVDAGDCLSLGCGRGGAGSNSAGSR